MRMIDPSVRVQLTLLRGSTAGTKRFATPPVIPHEDRGGIRPLLSPRRFLPAMTRRGQRPCHRAAILSESVGVVKRHRRRPHQLLGLGRTPWRFGGGSAGGWEWAVDGLWVWWECCWDVGG